MRSPAVIVLAALLASCGGGPHGARRGSSGSAIRADAVTACPFLQGSYPTTYPDLPAAERDARAAAFRTRNAGTWTTVSLDELGAVNIVTGVGPGLVQDSQPEATPRELASWLRFVRANPDYFGVAGCTLALTEAGSHGTDFRITGDPARGAAGFIAFEKTQTTEGGYPHYVVNIVGQLVRSATIPPRRIADSQARSALVGKRYAINVPPAPRPVSDVPPGYKGPRASDDCLVPYTPGCGSSGELVVAPGDVFVTELVQCVGTGHSIEVRRVLRLDVGAAGGSGSTQIMPRDGAPQLPVYVDAVTGEAIAGVPEDCH